MMTIDIETISGVPFTGELKTVRPTTSATTRKLRRKASVAAKASNAFAVRSLQRSSKLLLLYLIPHRPLMAELFGLLQRELEHLAAGQAGLVELGCLLLRPALERVRPFDAHRLGELAHRGADALELLELLGIVLLVHRTRALLVLAPDLHQDLLHILRQPRPAVLVDGEPVPGDGAEADLGVVLADFIELKVDVSRREHDPAVVHAGLHGSVGIRQRGLHRDRACVLEPLQVEPGAGELAAFEVRDALP